MRIVVVLPAPFGPRKPTISPSAAWRSTPATATTSLFREWKTLRRPSVWIIMATTCSLRCRSVGR